MVAIAWLIYGVHQGRKLVDDMGAQLQGAICNLVRHMENDPVGTPGKLARNREALLSRIAIEGNERLRPLATSVPAPLGMNFPPAPNNDPQLTSAAQALLQWNERTSSDFWFKANGIRTGCQVFLALMELRNPMAAYILMTDHMKRQRDEWAKKETKRLPNFTEMKLVLGLPTEWPEGDQPERWQRRLISEHRARTILIATARYRERIFKGIQYKPWPLREDEDAPVFYEDGVLNGLREYIR